MIKHLHEAGYKLVLWHTSWIDSKSNPPGEPGFEGKLLEKSPNYDEAALNGYFVKNPDGTPWVGPWWKGKGSLLDFTNPGAKLWWQNQVRKAITAGADGFKDDDAEGAFLGNNGTEPVIFHDGSDQRLMRNRYGTLYNNAVEELIQKDLHGNGVLFARSVTTGANNLGFLWGRRQRGQLLARQRPAYRRHSRHLRRALRHAALGSRSRRLPRPVRHPQPPPPPALDRVRRLLPDDGGHVLEEHRSLDLRQRTHPRAQRRRAPAALQL